MIADTTQPTTDAPTSGKQAPTVPTTIALWNRIAAIYGHLPIATGVEKLNRYGPAFLALANTQPAVITTDCAAALANTDPAALIIHLTLLDLYAVMTPAQIVAMTPAIQKEYGPYSAPDVTIRQLVPCDRPNPIKFAFIVSVDGLSPSNRTLVVAEASKYLGAPAMSYEGANNEVACIVDTFIPANTTMDVFCKLHRHIYLTCSPDLAGRLRPMLPNYNGDREYYVRRIPYNCQSLEALQKIVLTPM